MYFKSIDITYFRGAIIEVRIKLVNDCTILINRLKANGICHDYKKKQNVNDNT